MLRSKRPEHTRRKAIRSRCAGSMLDCTLNTTALKPESITRGSPPASRRAAGAGAMSTMASSSSRTPKLVRAEPKNTGDSSPASKRLMSSSAPASSSNSTASRASCQADPSSAAARVASTISSPATVAPPAVPPETHEVAAAAVDQAAEPLTLADRPGDGHRVEHELVLDLVEQLEGVAGRAVPLVDERHDGDLAVAAHLEQLAGLGLDALGSVEHHHRGVHRGQHPVGVLGEVAVARRVEQVQNPVPVAELHDGRCDGDAPAAFQFCPVRGGRPALALAPHRARPGCQCPAVEQELLGKGGLARVGMRDDRERAPSRRLSADFSGGRGVGAHAFSVARADTSASPEMRRSPTPAGPGRRSWSSSLPRWACRSKPRAPLCVTSVTSRKLGEVMGQQ